MRIVRGLGSYPSRDTKVHHCFATGVVAAVWEAVQPGTYMEAGDRNPYPVVAPLH